MTCGIYIIQNDVSNKVYVGSSKHIERRIKHHFATLKRNKHINIKLQRSYNKHKEDAFSYQVIFECPKDKLYDYEDYFILEYDSINSGYNITGARFGDVLSNHPDKADIILKIRNSITLLISEMTVKERQDKWGKFGSDNPNFKGVYNKCSCGTVIYKHNKTCIKCRDRSSVNNSFYGKHHTDATKRLLSESAKQRALLRKPSNSKKIEIDGVVCFKSYTDAAIFFGISHALVAYRVKSIKYNWSCINA